MRLSGQRRPDPASVGCRIIGESHSKIRQRSFALFRGTDDPAPTHGDLGDEDLVVNGLGSVETHRSGMKLAVDMQTAGNRQR